MVNRILAADAESKLVYIDETLIDDILDKKLSPPAGYSQGHLEENDLFLLIIPQMEILSSALKEKIEELCSSQLPLSGFLIFTGIWQNETVKPLIKTVSTQQLESGILLQTIFNGQKIKIKTNKEEIPTFSAQINGQQLTFNSEIALPLMIYNKKGIKYFSTECCDSLREATRILSGERFESYLDKTLPCHNILRKEISDLLLTKDSAAESTESWKKITIAGDKKFLITKIPCPFGQTSLQIWQFSSEAELLKTADECTQAYRRMHETVDKIESLYNFGLQGDDPKINHIQYLLQKSAVTKTTILLTGESGTGKTYTAQEIHKYSKRSNGAFIHVNCAAIPYNLIESELFGYEEGAFTGAKKGGKAGYFEMAKGGTLFLDEITEIPMKLQGKLLEVIQNRTFFRVGGDRKIQADVRIIAATNRDLAELVRQQKFREDLYYRINVFPIELPPLRKRRDTLGLIALDLLKNICDRLEVDQQVISVAAMKKMIQYTWPGNIRELENVLEKACILSDGKMIMPQDIEVAVSFEPENTQAQSLKQMREGFEKQIIAAVLKQNHGSKVKTARQLEIGKTSLFEKIKKYGLEETEKGEIEDDNDFNS